MSATPQELSAIFDALNRKLDTMAEQLQESQQQIATLTNTVEALSEDLLRPKAGILPIKEAAKALGVSYYACYNRIKDGRYREGIEAFDRRSPGASKAYWHLNVEACRVRDNVPMYKRKIA